MKKPKNTINVYTTPPDGRCGIGIYTKKLITHIASKTNNFYFKEIYVDVNRKNLFYYIKKAIDLSNRCNIAHVQFEYNFMGNFPVTGFYIPIFFTILKMLSIIKKFKIILTIHGVWESSNPPRGGILGKIYVKVINWFLINIPHKIIALSEDIEEKLIREGCNRRKINTIPHGSDDPLIIDSAVAKSKLNIDPSKIVITLFGYIKPEKGHDVFIRASKYFENENIVFLIAGDLQPEKNKKYFELLKSIAGKNVVFMGFVRDEEVPVIFSATDIMILPYRAIGVSGVLNLAMAYRVPTIASDLPYFKKLQEKYECVILFKSGSVEDLVQKIRVLLNNRNIANKLKEKMDAYWQENSWNIVVHKHLELYSQLLQ